MPEEIKTVSFSITKNMIKLVQDAESGIVPQEGDKEYGDEWVKNKGIFTRFWKLIILFYSIYWSLILIVFNDL